ncbi:MAG: response regulator transcription factor [Acidobacteriota bacterium]|nr:response regulator transcription factor [Acidobacteriota bacterium]
MPTKILIVEDDRPIAELVAKNLSAAGFHCQQVHRGDEALLAAEGLCPDLVILDLLLPGLDGLEVMRALRRQGDVPVLLLTARSSESDKVLGFELGADDYLTKPFSTRELVARARALLRRTGGAQERELEHGDLRIDPARRKVLLSGGEVELTSLEFDLLHFLAARPGRVFSREALMDQVWGSGRVVDDRSIDSLVSRLRRKLEPEPSQPRYVQTVWGAGYRFPESS